MTFLRHNKDCDVNSVTKGIKNAAFISKATMVLNVTLKMMSSEVIVAAV
jgi:hypothetical protein